MSDSIFDYIAESVSEKTGKPVTTAEVSAYFDATSPAYRSGELWPVYDCYYGWKMEREHVDMVVAIPSGRMTFEPMQGDEPTTRYIHETPEQTEEEYKRMEADGYIIVRGTPKETNP